jgi:hypothetical protein
MYEYRVHFEKYHFCFQVDNILDQHRRHSKSAGLRGSNRLMQSPFTRVRVPHSYAEDEDDEDEGDEMSQGEDGDGSGEGTGIY